MGRQKESAQRDLFATAKPGATVPPEVARRLLPLLEQLLLEVMAAEGGDEQDHA